jgi:hypothetical protein
VAVLLKDKPQRELHITRILRTGDRAEAGGGAEHPAGTYWRIKIRVVKEIEYVQSELQLYIFVN